MDDWITPDWPAPPNVRALITTRSGGVSAGPYDSLNLGDHVGDDPVSVARNRALLARHLPAEPRWLEQMHGTRIVRADAVEGRTQADGAVTRQPNVVCAVMTADCLPVLLCETSGSAVGIVHAGWRGLLSGVIEAALAQMGPASGLMAYLGPAIGPAAFEVGDEVRAAFMRHSSAAASAFAPQGAGKWLADLYALARQRLAAAGVTPVYGGGFCTFREAGRFYSYRRERVTGRMASLIWLVD